MLVPRTSLIRKTLGAIYLRHLPPLGSGALLEIVAKFSSLVLVNIAT
jgi:hypothetical protein